jgi:two-component system cell cycle sensor histidine kinase/response regulator CckA
VLLVEDDALVRRTLTRALRTTGLEVIEAENAQDALHKLDEAVDVLVSDVVMPGGYAPDLVRAARDRGFEGAALLISGYADHAAAADPLLDEVELLHKPFSNEELIAKIAVLLGATASHDEGAS